MTRNLPIAKMSETNPEAPQESVPAKTDNGSSWPPTPDFEIHADSNNSDSSDSSDKENKENNTFTKRSGRRTEQQKRQLRWMIDLAVTTLKRHGGRNGDVLRLRAFCADPNGTRAALSHVRLKPRKYKVLKNVLQDVN